jgi:hypothetical protein
MSDPNMPESGTQPTIDEALAAEPADVAGEPQGKAVGSDTPIGDAALAAVQSSAPTAPNADAGISSQTLSGAPVHHYQVLHRVSVPCSPGARSEYTSVFLLAEDAIEFIRTHIL